MIRSFLLSAIVFSLSVLNAYTAPPFAFSSSTTLNDAAGDNGSDRGPALAANGSGTVIAVWDSSDDFGSTAGSDFDIFYAVSTDKGDTWTSPSLLNSNATTDSQADSDPSIATDGTTWMCVWRSDESISSSGTDPDIIYSISTDDGTTWSAVEVVNTNAATDGTRQDFNPAVVADGSGDFIAGWMTNSEFSGTHNLGIDFDPVSAIWDDFTMSWTVPIPLATNLVTNTGNGEQHLELATDGSGVVVAMWASNDTAAHPGIGSDYDILSSRSLDSGASWSASTVVNSYAFTDTSDEFQANIATDENGNWVVVWSSDDDLGGTIGTDDDILYAVSGNNGASWSPAAAVDPNAATDGTSHDGGTPAIVMRPGGSQWVVVWPTRNTLGGTIGFDFDLFISVSIDDGVTWSAGQPIEDIATAASDSEVSGTNELDVALTINGAEDYIAVWASDETEGGTTGFDYDLYVTTSSGLPVELSAFSLD